MGIGKLEQTMDMEDHQFVALKMHPLELQLCFSLRDIKLYYHALSGRLRSEYTGSWF